MVYVVIGHFNYQGVELIGVFATMKGARACQAKERGGGLYDDVTIKEYVPQP
jgi:hypothetical protein